MENYSENLKGQSVITCEPIRYRRNYTKVHKKALTKKLHQPFTHTTKNIREGQIPRNVKQSAGQSVLSVQNFLWRYNNKEKASWIR